MRVRRLVAVVGLLWASVSFGQTVGQDGQKVQGPTIRNASGNVVGVAAGAPVPMLVGGVSSADTVIRVLKLDASGNLTASDTDRDRDQTWYYTGIINHQQMIEDSQDSTEMVNTTGWNHMAAWVYPVCTGAAAGGSCDSLWAVLLALEVRGGSSSIGDSISAHPWVRWKTGTTVAGGGGVDTVGYFGNPMSGLLNKVDPSREIAVVAIVNPELGLTPTRGQLIELRDPRSGAWFSSNYTSLKFRFVEGYQLSDGAAIASAGPIKLRVDLFGWR